MHRGIKPSQVMNPENSQNMQKILPIKPDRYFEQGITGCGGFSVKGILSAFGKDDRESAFDYYPFLKWGVLSTPSRWRRMFEAYGLQVRLGKADDDADAVALMKGELDKGRVLMLRIGNGYTKQGVWHRLAWRSIGHWITLWGYDDNDRTFYIYDSWIPQGRAHLPVGNIKRPYMDVARDWNGGFPFRWRRTYLAVWNEGK